MHQVMKYGLSMKVSSCHPIQFKREKRRKKLTDFWIDFSLTKLAVDYILFLTLDPEIEPNLNEVSDIKWVSKVELQAFFLDPCTSFASNFLLLSFFPSSCLYSL